MEDHWTGKAACYMTCHHALPGGWHWKVADSSDKECKLCPTSVCTCCTGLDKCRLIHFTKEHKVSDVTSYLNVITDVHEKEKGQQLLKRQKKKQGISLILCSCFSQYTAHKSTINRKALSSAWIEKIVKLQAQGIPTLQTSQCVHAVWLWSLAPENLDVKNRWVGTPSTVTVEELEERDDYNLTELIEGASSVP